MKRFRGFGVRGLGFQNDQNGVWFRARVWGISD